MFRIEQATMVVSLGENMPKGYQKMPIQKPWNCYISFRGFCPNDALLAKNRPLVDRLIIKQ